MNVKRILLPVDGSRHSDAAATSAVDMAKSSNAEILLLVCRKPVPNELGEPNVQWVLNHYTQDAENILSAYRERFDRQDVVYRDRIVGGRPGEVIADVAKAEDCDIIVMGSKGKSDLEGLLLGSVTHKVLHTAHCPVLVVK
ncbi:universal stress protein [Desulfovibrio oxyclinae]|jgi:nucleotide-binding universal stress UspA family protein|uniref:universal stress protein n=1 Tax=Desulfovibrio oxyclinae TaxID=63560 RepID=UPI00037DE6CD|nr:universal stress protein [Desulfovibrio oxyclinae]